MIHRLLFLVGFAFSSVSYGAGSEIPPSRLELPALQQTKVEVASSTLKSQPAQSKWEPKDYVLAAGVVVTFLLGIWNLLANHRSSQRTMFVNTVTSQRVKWIEQLRQDISAFNGLVYHWALTDLPDPAEERQIIKEIDRLNHVIRLRLNPAGTYDKTIERLLADIPRHTSDQTKIKELLEKLTVASQALLKEEWEKVKAESRKGPLSDRA